jgi:cation diffusion facilitator family transporter
LQQSQQDTSRQKVIARASWYGIIGNGLLAGLSLAAGLLGRSMALVGAGIDTLTDVVTSVVTLYTSRITDKPPDETHPYGHGRAETIATKLLAFIIFFAGAQLALQTVGQLLSGETRGLPSMLALAVAGFSMLGKVLLALIKWRAGKRVESPMLIADAKNMVMDVFISLSVLIGVIFTVVLEMPVLDTLMGLAVSLWIMRMGLSIFLDTNTELMDGLADRSIYSLVHDTALEVPGVANPHKMRIRKLNNRYVVDIDIEVDGSLSVDEGHELAKAVQERIHRAVNNVYDVHVHVEPHGNAEARERFGLSGEHLDEKL